MPQNSASSFQVYSLVTCGSWVFSISWGWLLSLSGYVTGPYFGRALWTVYLIPHSGTSGTVTCRDCHPGNGGAHHPQNCCSGLQSLRRTRGDVSGNDFASLWPQWQILGLKSSPTLGARIEEFCSVGWWGSCSVQMFEEPPTETPLLRNHSTQDTLARRRGTREPREDVFSLWMIFWHVVISERTVTLLLFKHNHQLHSKV